MYMDEIVGKTLNKNDQICYFLLCCHCIDLKSVKGFGGVERVFQSATLFLSGCTINF